MDSFGLYVHIPYCGQRCPYCDFNTYVAPIIPEQDYTAAVCAELGLRAAQPHWKNRTLETIYFGGGTPSLFQAEHILRIVAEARRLFPSAPRVELSLEANPGTVSEARLTELRDGGFSRVSFGVQSLNAERLRFLGRAHSVEAVHEAVAAARAARFTSLNLDLIAALPNQTIEEFSDEVRGLLSFRPEHVSVYTLTIEKGTPFYLRHARGEFSLPDDQVTEGLLSYLREALTTTGFRHYEISNFALPGHECRHNQGYWAGRDYLGVGAGAHGFSAHDAASSFGRRWSNYAHPDTYMEACAAERLPEAWSEVRTRESALFECFFLGLRVPDGVSLDRLDRQFGSSAVEALSATFDRLEQRGFISRADRFIRATWRGMLVLDSVLEELVP